MTERCPQEDVVTVTRLVSLGHAERTGAESAIVATVGGASMRTEGDSIFLVIRDAATLRRLKVGDVVHGVAERFGVVWLAEQRAVGAEVAD